MPNTANSNQTSATPSTGQNTAQSNQTSATPLPGNTAQSNQTSATPLPGNTAQSNQTSATPHISLITVFPGEVAPNTPGYVLTLTGSGTAWTPGIPGSPIFTASAGFIEAQRIDSATSATIIYSSGDAGTVTIFDPSSGNSATLEVVAATPIPNPLTTLKNDFRVTGNFFTGEDAKVEGDLIVGGTIIGGGGGGGSGVNPGQTNNLAYYEETGSEVFPLVLGTNLSITDGTLNAAGGGGGGTSPGGSSGQLQYNNSGAFGGLKTVVYASAAGILPCNPANPQAGPDSSAAIQAVLNLGQNGPLEFVIDIPLLAQQLSIFSGTTIRGIGAYSTTSESSPQAGIWQATVTNGSNSCIFKNAHWISPYNNGAMNGIIVDQDITITDLYMDGQRRNGANGAGAPTPVSNADGILMSPIQIWGCNNLRLENLNIYDPLSFHTHVANIFNSVFKNLFFTDPVYLANQSVNRQTDGLHINGPAQYLYIDGLGGTTGDDFLPLNSADGNLDQTLSSGISGPGIFVDLNHVYCGNISNVVASNLRLVNSRNVCRFLTGTDPRPGGISCSVQNVTISQVTGTVGAGITGNTEPYLAEGGGKANIICRDWTLTPIITALTSGFAFMGGSWSNVSFEGIYFQNLLSSTQQPNNINFDTDFSCTSMSLIDCSIVEISSAEANPAPVISMTQGTIGVLNLIGCRWYRNTSTASVAYASITGGTLGRLNLTSGTFNSIANVISITSGATVTDINLFGMSHTNASSNPSLLLGGGVTLARLRAAGLDTVLLTSGGTITSEKTDSTQDA